MTRKLNFTLAAAGIALATSAAPVLAQTVTTETVETGSTIGFLECTVEGGVSLLLAGPKDAVCTFDQAEGETQTYVGTLDKIGIDIGVSGESFMKWAVVQLLDHTPEDLTLDGTYSGVSANASVGVGVGANVLVGGSNESIGLQPVSVEGKTGLNVAVALTKLTLSSVE